MDNYQELDKALDIKSSSSEVVKEDRLSLQKTSEEKSRVDLKKDYEYTRGQ